MKYKNFGKLIREIRTKRSISQVKFASLVGVSGQFISNTERGLCCLPRSSVEELVKKLGLQKSEKQMILGSILVDQMESARTKWKEILGL